jgi:hypothetical protein
MRARNTRNLGILGVEDPFISKAPRYDGECLTWNLTHCFWLL